MSDVIVKIGANSSQLKTGLQEAKREVNSFSTSAGSKIEAFGKSIAGAFTIGAIVGFARQIAGAAGDIQDAADRMNLTAESVQTLGDYFGESGVNAKTFEKGINGINSAIGEALTGSTKARDSFAELGVSIDDLKNAESAEEIVYKISDALKSGGVSAQEFAALSSLVGEKVANKMVPGLKAGSEAIKEFQANVSKFTNEEIAKIDQGWDDLMRNMKSAAIDAAHAIADTFKGIGKVMNLGDKSGQATQDLFNAGKPGMKSIGEMDKEQKAEDGQASADAAEKKKKAEAIQSKEESSRVAEAQAKIAIEDALNQTKVEQEQADIRSENAADEASAKIKADEDAAKKAKEMEEQITKDAEVESEKRIAQAKAEQQAKAQRVQDYLMTPQERQAARRQARREERAGRTLDARDRSRESNRNATDNNVKRPNVFRGVDQETLKRARQSQREGEKFGPPAPKAAAKDAAKTEVENIAGINKSLATLVSKIEVKK